MGVFSNSLKANKNNKNLKIAIITSEWNSTITNNLLSETIETLLKFGVKKTNISNYKVPGSFELIYASKRIAKNKEINAIITIGCIIKGDTPHFEYICESVTNGIKDLNILLDVPVIFGVLTTQNLEQAKKRSEGDSNKGREFAVSALQMTKI